MGALTRAFDISFAALGMVLVHVSLVARPREEHERDNNDQPECLKIRETEPAIPLHRLLFSILSVAFIDSPVPHFAIFSIADFPSGVE